MRESMDAVCAQANDIYWRVLSSKTELASFSRLMALPAVPSPGCLASHCLNTSRGVSKDA